MPQNYPPVTGPEWSDWTAKASAVIAHDPLCQFSNPIPGVELTCTCPALRLARADQDKKSRADERKRLREQVKALPTVSGGWATDEYGRLVERDAVLIGDVLALLGGESNELGGESNE